MVKFCLNKASTNNNGSKGEASCLGTSELLLVVDWEVYVVVGASGVLLLLGSNV